MNIKSPAEAPAVHAVALVAQNIAFHPTTLTLSAGERVQIKFDNRDAGVPHNFVLFNGVDANAPQLFRGTVVTGPATVTYPFTAPPPGTYFFHCEIHPTQMTGTVTVGASSGGQAAGGGSGAGALRLTAKSLAFSPGSLTAPAGVGKITVHFDNEDPEVPHNLVVFNGKDASSPILFRGPPLTGPGTVDYAFAAPPPGTYFYHCEFHPTTMTGTLTVS